MTYDGFHKNADRIYLVRHKSDTDYKASGISQNTPAPLAAYLKETFPEVEASCHLNILNIFDIEAEGVTHEMSKRNVDTAFLNMFRVRLLSGTIDFTVPQSKNVAVTEKYAKTLFGNESPLGKQFTLFGTIYTVCAVVSEWQHSNYHFDVLFPATPSSSYWGDSGSTFIMLKAGTDVDAFAEKLHKHKIERDKTVFTDMLITPITSVRYDEPDSRNIEIAFKYIVLFAIAGGLVIICSLFNILTLFTVRFRIRERELALRTVCGASSKSLFVMLSTEYLLILLIAFTLGTLCIHAVLEPFKKMSHVDLPVSAVYGELLAYAAAIIAVSLIFFLLLLFMFRRKALNVSIRSNGENLSRKLSVTLQLIISIIFIFCTTVTVKQIYFLHHTDLGFEFKNTAFVSFRTSGSESIKDVKALEHRMKQMPEITDILMGSVPFIPQRSNFLTTPIKEWDDMPPDAKPIFYEIRTISKQVVDFYNLRLTEGEFIDDERSTTNDIWINETLAKTLGWNKSTGKKLEEGFYTVRGVFKDIHNGSPTAPVKPLVFRWGMRFTENEFPASSIIVKYQAGKWKSCKAKIEQLAREEYPNANFYTINSEERFDTYMKSEAMLIKLLLCVSLICIIISVFGLFSLVALSCERRQKEIAIRKINGATVKDILDMYFKEYLLLLFAGAIIAFPLSYLMMKPWLQQYVKQTVISAWIYIAILLLLALIIVMCIGWRVYRAAKSNPAEEIKK
jgi:ABC-type antimicrobial peptide transport system permease subunit